MTTPSAKCARAKFDQWFVAYDPSKVRDSISGSVPVAEVLIRYFAAHPDQLPFRAMLLKHIGRRAIDGNLSVDVAKWK